jgi:hypothetical protein
MLGIVSIGKGQMNHGLSMVEQALRTMLESKRRCWYSAVELSLGQVYLHIVNKSAPVPLSIMVKNIGFIMRNVPFAATKAEEHLKEAIQVSKEIGAKGTLGEAYLDLGSCTRQRAETSRLENGSRSLFGSFKNVKPRDVSN